MEKQAMYKALMGLGLGLLVALPTGLRADGDAASQPIGDTANPLAGETISRDEFNGLVGDLQTLRDDETRQYQRLTANTLRFVQFGGTVQTRYTFRDDGNPTYPNQFTIPLAQLTLKGSLFKDYADGHNLDFSLGLSYGSIAGSVANGNTNTAFTLADANITYAILATSDPTKPFLSVTFGQQFKPYGLEPQVTEAYKPTINPAYWTTPAGYGLATRDLGLVINGDFLPNADFGNNYRVPLVQYQLGLFNGTGANTSWDSANLPAKAAYNGAAYSYSTADNNQDKDLYGRLAFNAPVDYNNVFRGLTLGLSVAQLHRNGTNGSTITARTVTGDEQSVRYGGDISYVNVPVGFTFEYVQGEDSNLASTATGAAITPANTYNWTKQSYGATGTVFYEWGQQFVKDYINQSRQDDYYPKTYQLFARADVWNPNSGGGSVPAQATQHAETIGTLGFNAFFASTTKFQFNYQARKDEGQNFHSDQYLAQFQYGF